MSGNDLQDWFGTRLGLQMFVASVKNFTTREEFELLLRWVSRRGHRLSDAELEWATERAEVLRMLLERWEPIGFKGEGGLSREWVS